MTERRFPPRLVDDLLASRSCRASEHLDLAESVVGGKERRGVAEGVQTSSMTRRNALLVRLTILSTIVFFGLAIPSTSASSGPSASENDYVIDGRIKLEGIGPRPLASKLASARVILNGGQQLTFVRPDGYFAFRGVSAGTHLLEVSLLGYSFSSVRIDVSARLHGQVRATAIETRRYYADALVLEPMKEEYYYEKREPFSVMSLVKSPMGLMVGFMLVALFLLPKLMDSIDPEEMKRVQEEMRNQPAPSFSNLLQGGGQ